MHNHLISLTVITPLLSRDFSGLWCCLLRPRWVHHSSIPPSVWSHRVPGSSVRSQQQSCNQLRTREPRLPPQGTAFRGHTEDAEGCCWNISASKRLQWPDGEACACLRVCAPVSNVRVFPAPSITGKAHPPHGALPSRVSQQLSLAYSPKQLHKWHCLAAGRPVGGFPGAVWTSHVTYRQPASSRDRIFLPKNKMRLYRSSPHFWEKTKFSLYTFCRVLATFMLKYFILFKPLLMASSLQELYLLTGHYFYI